jgi:hypothetical protein
MTYRAIGLDPADFRHLFAMTDEELSRQGAVRRTAEQPGVYPCRIALERVGTGEELILFNFEHHAAPASPYRAKGPIFISKSAGTQRVETGRLPPMIRDVLLSLRAYDNNGFLVEAEVSEGPYADGALRRFFANPRVASVHAHFARQGCYAARFERA